MHDVCVMLVPPSIRAPRDDPFSLLVPVTPSAYWSPDSDAGRNESSDEGYHGTILVVDDEPLVLDVAKSILEEAGYRVLTAANGEDALATYLRHGEAIDLVILDYVMPGLNGFDTWQQLTTIDENVRVLFCSGYLADRELSALLAATSCEFIAKPYTIRDFLARIRHLLTDDD